jgi:sugar/nucleoside kinase (ribokinase family)
VIVVVGNPAWREAEPAGPAGLACEVAATAAARGRRVELVGRIGDDRPGDALVIALNRVGVGHAAVLRDPTLATALVAPPAEAEEPLADGAGPAVGLAAGPRLEAADVSLALSYLTAFAVLVVTDDVPRAALPAAIDGAAFAGAHLVLLLAPGAAAPDGLPAATTVLGVPDASEAGAFGTVVGVYAEGLDAGLDPARAFRAAIGDWEPADDEGGDAARA